MTDSHRPISPRAMKILRAIQAAVDKNLDQKRRLGHYVTFWQDGEPVLVGPDAPKAKAEADGVNFD